MTHQMSHKRKRLRPSVLLVLSLVDSSSILTEKTRSVAQDPGIEELAASEGRVSNFYKQDLGERVGSIET